MPEDHCDDGAFSSVRTICALGRPRHHHGLLGLDTDFRGQACINPDLLATLTEAGAAGMKLLLVHAVGDELPTGAIRMLRHATIARNLWMIDLPINDYGVPSAAFLRNWCPLRIHPARAV